MFRTPPDDPGLPRLRDLFPIAGMPDFVAAALAERGLEAVPQLSRLIYVRYRPLRSCDLLWRVRTADGIATAAAGKLLHEGRKRRPDTRNGAARYLPEHRLLLQVFPHDERLPGLVDAASTSWAEGTLAPALGLSGGVSVYTASYKPWRRCVQRYEIAGGRYFGKLYRDDRGPALSTQLRAVAAHLRETHAPWQIVGPRAYLPDQRMLVFPDAGEGTKLSKLMKPALDDASARARLLDGVACAAAGLRAFQGAPIDGLRAIGPDEIISTLRRKAASIAAVAPELGRRVEGAARALEDAAGRLEAEPLAPVHGAFRHGQLLLREAETVVLDLDTLCLGGRSADAGTFLAYFDRSWIRRPAVRPAVEECRDAFVEQLDRSGAGERGWRAWHRSAALAQIAVRTFLSVEPDWPELTGAYLDAAQQALAPALPAARAG